MNKRKGVLISEVIAGVFGWIWILSSIATFGLIAWAIFGGGRWYYPVISFCVGAFCKSLCREYKKQSQELIYESAGVNYAQEWIDLPENEKKEIVVNSFRQVVAKYHGEADVDSWVSKWDESNRFEDMVKEITSGYAETGLAKPYNVVCPSFIENYFMAIVKAK